MFLRLSITIFFLMFYLLSNVFADNVIAKDVIIVNSIPKSGTHLVTKCIEILTGKKTIWAGQKPSSPKMPQRPRAMSFFGCIQRHDLLFAHFTYDDAFNDFFDSMKCKCFFVYRDPRAQIVSMAHWRIKCGSNNGLNLTELISSLINQPLLYQNFLGLKNINGICDLYNAYMPWAGKPHFCIIRFEDLVGPQGGGDAQKQYCTVKKIAQHLGLSVDETTLNNVCAQMFGNTSTFHEGQIAGWKKYFISEHKQLFKQHAGQLLIDLGYEKDLNW